MDLTPSEKESSLSVDVADNVNVYVTEIKYNYKNGYVDSYTVKLEISGHNSTLLKSYRVKVTPKDKITGAVVEAVQYTSISCGGNSNCKGEVTFNCRVPSGGDAAYCSDYDFVAEIVQ